MKIVQKRSRKNILSVILWIIAAAVMLMVIILSSPGGMQGNLSDLLAKVRYLRLNPARADVPALIMDMPFTEYERILGQREEALAAGVVLLNNGDFVLADVRFQDQVVPVEMRLKQGEAVHLNEGDKWNFDVRTRNDQQLSGMQRFYLIDPTDNNWLNEAAFAQALQSEGLIAGRYQFVQLFLNGVDKGIYALQEGFGSELLTSNHREEGVIVEFDPASYWESLAYYDGDAEMLAADPISNLNTSDFKYFEVDTFRDAAIAENVQLTQQKDRAIGLLRGLQSGELAASEVFDVQKYGRFLALVDLWGALRATSLVNLRYYYNPDSDRLEPIGFNGQPLINNQRLPISATYGDHDIQTAYVKSLAAMIDPGYLTEMQDELSMAVQSDQRALSIEAELDLPWDRLTERAGQISRSLSPLQPIIAYLGSPSLTQQGIIQLDVANVLNLPVEILGFDIGGATFLEVNPEWVQNNPEELFFGANGQVYLEPQGDNDGKPLRFVRFHLPLSVIISQDEEIDFLQELDLQVATRISGLDNNLLIPARSGYPDPLAIISLRD